MGKIKVYLSKLKDVTYTTEGHYQIIKIPDYSLMEYSRVIGRPMLPGEKRIVDIIFKIEERSE